MHFHAFLYLDNQKHLRGWRNIRNIQMRIRDKRYIYIISDNMEMNEEILIYGIKTVFVLLVHILSLIAIGMFMNMMTEGILYILSFMLLRGYTGGYHTNSNMGCYILSCISIVAALYLYKIGVFENIIINVIICIAAGIMIYLYSPMEHKNRPLNHVERRIFRKKSIYVYIVEFIFGILSGIIGRNCQVIIAAIFINFCAMTGELWHRRIH